MKIPKKIKIDNLTYKVFLVNKAVVKGFKSKKRILCGFVDSNKQIIRVATKYSKDEVAETLLHEILHSCCFRENVNLKEGETIKLSRRLHQVLKDNKLIF